MADDEALPLEEGGTQSGRPPGDGEENEAPVRDSVESAMGSAMVASIATGIVNGVASGALSFALNAGAHAARQVALTCTGLREIDWVKHATSAGEAAKSAATVTRAALVAHAPQVVAAIAAATDKSERIPFYASMTFSERREMSAKLRQQMPDRCPVIVERASGTTLPLLKKRKFLVPYTMTNAMFAYSIRKSLEVPASKGVWLSTADLRKTPLGPPQDTVMEFYGHYASDDGFLYLEYREENVFGA